MRICRTWCKKDTLLKRMGRITTFATLLGSILQSLDEKEADTRVKETLGNYLNNFSNISNDWFEDLPETESKKMMKRCETVVKRLKECLNE